ncbi:hypothetical protein RFI_34766, partial [Reticulomyxa filosa]
SNHDDHILTNADSDNGNGNDNAMTMAMAMAMTMTMTMMQIIKKEEEEKQRYTECEIKWPNQKKNDTTWNIFYTWTTIVWILAIVLLHCRRRSRPMKKVAKPKKIQ